MRRRGGLGVFFFREGEGWSVFLPIYLHCLFLSYSLMNRFSWCRKYSKAIFAKQHNFCAYLWLWQRQVGREYKLLKQHRRHRLQLVHCKDTS